MNPHDPTPADLFDPDAIPEGSLGFFVDAKPSLPDTRRVRVVLQGPGGNTMYALDDPVLGDEPKLATIGLALLKAMRTVTEELREYPDPPMRPAAASLARSLLTGGKRPVGRCP